MTLGDWQLFWHEHRKRQRLATSITLGKGYTERLGDDGEIVRVPYDTIAAFRSVCDLERAKELRSLSVDTIRKLSL